MKLYYAPWACSLADHIALEEAGASYERERVDLKTKRTASGRDLHEITPKGYVPVLALADGEILTENIAVLSWIADRANALGADGASRYRLLETLAFISAELHKTFKPFFNPAADANAKAEAGKTVERRLEYMADQLNSDYLFGDDGNDTIDPGLGVDYVLAGNGNDAIATKDATRETEIYCGPATDTLVADARTSSFLGDSWTDCEAVRF